MEHLCFNEYDYQAHLTLEDPSQELTLEVSSHEKPYYASVLNHTSTFPAPLCLELPACDPAMSLLSEANKYTPPSDLLAQVTSSGLDHELESDFYAMQSSLTTPENPYDQPTQVVEQEEEKKDDPDYNEEDESEDEQEDTPAAASAEIPLEDGEIKFEAQTGDARHKYMEYGRKHKRLTAAPWTFGMVLPEEFCLAYRHYSRKDSGKPPLAITPFKIISQELSSFPFCHLQIYWRMTECKIKEYLPETGPYFNCQAFMENDTKVTQLPSILEVYI